MGVRYNLGWYQKYDHRTFTESQVIDLCKRRIRHYAKGKTCIYIGISVTPDRRYYQHNRAIEKQTSTIITNGEWPECTVFYQTGANLKVREIERKLVDWAIGKYKRACWNSTGGGGGRRPKNKRSNYIYILTDDAVVKWKD